MGGGTTRSKQTRVRVLRTMVASEPRAMWQTNRETRRARRRCGGGRVTRGGGRVAGKVESV